MKSILTKILNKHALSEEECEYLIDSIESDVFNEFQLAGILSAMQLRGEKLTEIRGFRSALLRRSLTPLIDSSEAIDLCGTGGDGKNTFNISTTTSLVMAALGYKVIKHGNHGVSSGCGSSTVIEALGFELTSNTTKLEKNLKETNLCFLHAPLFHPTLQKVAPLRQKLGIRTVFNALGPLINPVQPAYQLTGTFSLELARTYAQVLRSERKAFAVFHGMGGYDELTLSDATRTISTLEDRILQPSNYHLQPILPQRISAAASPRANAQLIRAILMGNGSEEQTHVIAANVTEARLLFHPEADRIELFQETKDFILNGHTAKHFKLN
jgi:anthranilate phosphoribosyltransferase